MSTKINKFGSTTVASMAYIFPFSLRSKRLSSLHNSRASAMSLNAKSRNILELVHFASFRQRTAKPSSNLGSLKNLAIEDISSFSKKF